MRLVLIPGWNEGAEKMRVLVDGRNGIEGLTANGFDCAIFDGGRGTLRERIDQLAQFIAGLRSSDRLEQPLGLFGYSAGGLIARGFLHAYPDVTVAAIFQLAAPNAGIVTDDPRGLLRRMHFDRSVIEDLDLESPFMLWLNRTRGRWEPDEAAREKRWTLDTPPWITSAHVPIFNLIGRMPRYHDESDGVIRIESATLNGRVPHAFIDGNRANHLNLSGASNPFTFLLRGWRADDRLWPLAVAAATIHFRGATTAESS